MKSFPPNCRSLALILACLVALSGCWTLPRYLDAERDAREKSGAPLRIVGADGGLMHGARVTIEAQLRSLDADGSLARHLNIVTAIANAPLVVGNATDILIDGPNAYASIFAAIRAATDHIHIESFIFEEVDFDDRTSGFNDRLSAALIAKQKEGVTVRVLYDSVGSLSTPREFLDRLHEAGVQLCEFNPVNPLRAKLWRPNHRDHRKIVVVDGRVAFTGGINFHQVYRSGSAPLRMRSMPSTSEGWRDTHLRVRGPVVREFQELFVNSWTKQACGGQLDGALFAQLEAAGSEIIKVVGSSPDGMLSRMYLTLISAMSYARKSIYLTAAYFIPDPDTITALVAARARGVDVRLLLPGFTDSWLAFHGGRSHYEALLAGGVRIYEHRDALLHAKTAVIDGVWSTIGSSNIDWRSFCHNDEVNAVVLGESFGMEMTRIFNDDLSAAVEITAADWAERGPSDRILEWLARRWDQLL